MLLAAHPEPDMGNLYCPVRGVVSEINERYIVIAAKPPRWMILSCPRWICRPLKGRNC